MRVCPKCGEDVVEGHKFCGACGAKLAAETTPSRRQVESAYQTEQRKAPISEESKEVVFYSDDRGVRVTNTRLIIIRRQGSTTYAMVNITSVSDEKIDPNRWAGIVLAILGMLILVGGLYEGSDIALVSGGVFLGLGILLAAIVRPTYKLRVDSASGKDYALSSKDRQYIQGIVTAMNEAMIKRGW